MLTLIVDNEQMNISYGHFAGLVEEIVEWCKEHVATTEEDFNALGRLANYSIDNYQLSAEDAKTLYLMMTKEDVKTHESLQSYMHGLYECDCFDYMPFYIDAANGLYSRSMSATFSRTITSNLKEMLTYQSYNENVIKNLQESNKSFEAKQKHNEWLSFVDFVVSFNNDAALSYDFAEPEYGMEDCWVSVFINLLGRAALLNTPMIFS